MHIRSIWKYVIIALLAATLAGCGAGPVIGNVSPTPGQSTDNTAPVTANKSDGLCSNSLVPIKKDATWTYTNTGVATDPVQVTTTISDVRSDGFTVATRFDDSTTVDQEWACTSDGLVALSLGSAQATLGLSLQGMTASFVTSDPAGVTLPSNVQSGRTWQYVLSANGNISQGNNLLQVAGKADTAFTADGTESVTVPAGTFDATKVRAKTTLTINANYYGLAIPVTSVVNSTLWFSPGVGWIKSVQTGNLPGQSINSVTELQSYNIP